FLGGAILGLTLAFKPNLVFIVIVLTAHWILSGNFRSLWFHAIGGISGGALAILFAAVSFHDFRCWTEWLSVLHSLSNDKVIAINNGNCSPAQMIYEWLHVNITLFLAIVLTGFAVWLLWNRWKNLQRQNRNELAIPPEV